MVRWPEEDGRRERLRAEGVPRLLLVDAEAPPPAVTDVLEDWVRVPAGERDVQARVDALLRRVEEEEPSPPHIDDDGLLRFADGWVALSPVETELAAVLSERYGAVVGRDVLARRAWPDGLATRNALDVHVLRLRRRIAEVGLEVRTVRGRGYVLQEASEQDVGSVRTG